MPVGTKLSDELINSWFKLDWHSKTNIVEKNKNTSGLTQGKMEALTDAVFNGISVSGFKKGDNETFFLRYLKGLPGTIKLRIGQLILFKDEKRYNLDYIKDKKSKESLEKLAQPDQSAQPDQLIKQK